MANLVASDLTYTIFSRKKIEDNRKIVDVRIAFGDGVKTYPALGVPLDNAKMDCPVVVNSFLIDDMNYNSSILIKHDPIHSTLRLYNTSESSPSLPAGSPAMGAASIFS